MILAIDIGNSRIKWGMHDNGGWLATGAADKNDLDVLAAAWKNGPSPGQIIASSVADPAIVAAINARLACWPVAPRWISAEAQQCGVSNGYRTPSQLGSDRWTALIAARRRTSAACLVVNCGTAMTVDALSASGRFLGGLIVPGLSLMEQALERGTKAIRLDGGDYQRFPDTTANAVRSGCLNALCGAVERMAYELSEAHGTPHCFLSGGNAQDVLPRLRISAEVVDNLVLEGLIGIAHSCS